MLQEVRQSDRSAIAHRISSLGWPRDDERGRAELTTLYGAGSCFMKEAHGPVSLPPVTLEAAGGGTPMSRPSGLDHLALFPLSTSSPMRFPSLEPCLLAHFHASADALHGPPNPHRRHWGRRGGRRRWALDAPDQCARCRRCCHRRQPSWLPPRPPITPQVLAGRGWGPNASPSQGRRATAAMRTARGPRSPTVPPARICRSAVPAVPPEALLRRIHSTTDMHTFGVN